MIDEGNETTHHGIVKPRIVSLGYSKMNTTLAIDQTHSLFELPVIVFHNARAFSGGNAFCNHGKRVRSMSPSDEHYYPFGHLSCPPKYPLFYLEGSSAVETIIVFFLAIGIS